MMNKKRPVGIIFLISCVFISIGFILVRGQELTPSEAYKFKVDLQQCCHSYTAQVDPGTHFGITAEITNIGTVINPPLTIWLLYDNKICDKRELDKSYGPNEILFKDIPNDGRFFRCDVELPGIPAEAKKINKLFKLLYTIGKQNPFQKGATFFSGKTKEFCGVCVE
jgi:hypothetical protein